MLFGKMVRLSTYHLTCSSVRVVLCRVLCMQRPRDGLASVQGTLLKVCRIFSVVELVVVPNLLQPQK